MYLDLAINQMPFILVFNTNTKAGGFYMKYFLPLVFLCGSYKLRKDSVLLN